MKKLLWFNTQYIDHYMQVNKISKKEFCNKCNIDENLLNKIYSQDESIDIFAIIPILDLPNITSDIFLFREKFYATKKST